MKPNILDLLKSLVWVEVLCLVGCSTLGTMNTPSSAFTPLDIPTSSMTMVPTLLPFTGKIAFISENSTWTYNHLFVMQANGDNMMDITPQNLSLTGNISWSPDGQYIAFDALKDGVIQIFKVKTDGTNLVQLTFGENDASRPSWSPNGKNILFGTSEQSILDFNDLPAQQIYIMGSDGSNVHRLVVNSKAENKSMSGRYRMDGLIAISEPVTRYANVNYVVNSDGFVQAQFPEFKTTSPIVWSPDGKFIIYTSDYSTSNCPGFFIRSGNSSSGVSCLSLENAIVHQTNGRMTNADGASWSPDSKYIIFSSNLDGDTDIYVIKPDGTGLFQITNLPGNEGGATWSADP